MSEITLNILASDIEETDYSNSDDCAITRALRRAGKLGWKDTGTEIQSETRAYIVELYKNKSFTTLSKRVVDMYYNDLKPEDFTHTITY
jgi:hypothetical protein